jgi:DNA ligase D-like protein (predicted ligase)
MTLPAAIKPMLATASEPFDSPNHLFEVKWDGLRCIAFLDGATRLQSRNLKDLSAGFPELNDLHRFVDGHETVLDGEVITLLDGKPNFLKLQRRIHSKTAASIQQAAREVPCIFMAFDLLYLNGRETMSLPLEERRALMTQAVHPEGVLQISETTAEQGTALFEATKRLGLEGVVGKERLSRYLPGKRSTDWRKIKSIKRNTFFICGYTTNPLGRQDLSALALAARVGQQLGFFGLVGTGLSQSIIDSLLVRLSPLRTEAPPPFIWPAPRLPHLQWVKPVLICEVEYLELTPDLHLRHPCFKGLREDCGENDCRMG